MEPKPKEQEYLFNSTKITQESVVSVKSLITNDLAASTREIYSRFPTNALQEIVSVEFTAFRLGMHDYPPVDQNGTPLLPEGEGAEENFIEILFDADNAVRAFVYGAFAQEAKTRKLPPPKLNHKLLMDENRSLVPYFEDEKDKVVATRNSDPKIKVVEDVLTVMQNESPDLASSLGGLKIQIAETILQKLTEAGSNMADDVRLKLKEQFEKGCLRQIAMVYSWLTPTPIPDFVVTTHKNS